MEKSKIGRIKHSFFSNLYTNEDLSLKEEDFCLEMLQTEFFSLYEVFLSNKSRWPEDNLAVLYIYYLCSFLIFYYQQEHYNSDLQKLKQIRKEIMIFWGEELAITARKSYDSFPDFLIEGLRTNIQDYFSSFRSISKLRSYIGKLNTNRSKFSYSRILASQAIFYLQKSAVFEFVQVINGVFGNQFSFNESINFFNNSRKTIADLGILLYGLGFLINLMLLAKHIIQSINSKELSTRKVLKQEIARRGFNMASDFVWAMGGGLTNYSSSFHISSSIVSPLILSFLTFDTFLLLAEWLFEANKFKEQVQELMVQQEVAGDFEQEVIQRQIDVLNDEWEAQCTYYTINIIGANLLATCFAISMLCTGPFSIAGMALLSMLGNALYNTSEEYKKYQKSEIALRRELYNGKILNDDHHQQLLKELQEERNQNHTQFWKDLAFNVGGIAFIITAAAASWPIALGLTLIYAAYRLVDAYQKEQKKNHQKVIPHDIYRLLNSKEFEVSLPSPPENGLSEMQPSGL